MTMAMRGCYQWQCMEVMNQSNWSPTSAEARLKQIPLEISELFLKQNLIMCDVLKKDDSTSQYIHNVNVLKITAFIIQKYMPCSFFVFEKDQ